jgi:hypothetical protein
VKLVAASRCVKNLCQRACPAGTCFSVKLWRTLSNVCASRSK